MSPFLTILTRTFKRPVMLEMNRRSLEQQTCQDYEQIIIPDKVGIGVCAANVLLRTQDCTGDYCWVLDDDEIVIDMGFISKLKSFALKNNPEVIVAESMRGSEGVIGNNPELELGNVGFINVVMRKDVWMKHRKEISNHYAGDWAMIKSMIDNGVVFSKLEGLMLMAQRVSRGAVE